MKSSTTLTILPLMAGGALARGYGSVVGNGPGGSWYHEEPLYREANRNPNATNSVTFDFGERGEQWTWRVNVTSISAPNATNLDTAPKPIGPDPRVVNTVYDFQWPNASAPLQKTAPDLCVSVLASSAWPNVTNKLQGDGASCAPAIGDECEAAILSSFRPLAGGQTCATPEAWWELDACQGIFPAVDQVTTLPIASNGSSNSNTTGSANNGTSSQGDPADWPVRSGNAFFFDTTQAFPNENMTALMHAESKMQMLALHGIDGTRVVNQLLCMRVDSSLDDMKYSDLANATQADATPTGSAPAETSSSAASTRAATVRGLGSVGLLGVVALVFPLC